MQKKLIALAVAGLVAAPAFAATSNVDIYGIMSMSVDYANSDSGSEDTDIVAVKSNASRIGFKGSEDLGGGLSAIWQIENEIMKANDNSGTAFGVAGDLRNTFVGLSSASMGTVVLGRHDTPYKLATGKLDLFTDTVGDYNAIIGASDKAGASSEFDLRADQTIAYITPTFSGFHAAAAYVGVKNQEAPGAENLSAWSLMGMYDNGPIFASLAYEKHNGGAAQSSATQDEKAWKLGAGYNFGNASIGGVYENITNDAFSNADRKAWMLNGKYNMGNITLKAQYAKADDSAAAGGSDGASYYALGADYALSKRTTVYGVYAKVDNDVAGDYELFGQSDQAVSGNAPSTFSLGVKHSF